MSSVDNRPRSNLNETYRALFACADMKMIKKGERTFPNMPDVGSDKYMIIVGKTAMIGTTRLGASFAVCIRGINKKNEPVIGLCHQTTGYHFEFVQDVLFKGMVKKGCDVRTISTYVIGGCRIKNETASTKKEEQHILRVSKERNVTGAKFPLMKTEMPTFGIEEIFEGLLLHEVEDTTSGCVVFTPKNVFFSNTGNLFTADEDQEDAGKDLPKSVNATIYDHIYNALSASKDITLIENQADPLVAPDVHMDKIMVVVGKNALLGTSKLSPCFAICTRGFTEEKVPVIGLCHSSGLMGFEDVHDALVEEMVAEGCVADTIATYVIGGDIEDTEEDTKSILISWKKRNIQGVKLYFDQDTESPNVLLSPTFLHYSLNDLFLPEDRKPNK